MGKNVEEVISANQHDADRFQKKLKEKGTTRFCFKNGEDGTICRFLKDGYNLEANWVALQFTDREGTRYSLKKDNSSFYEIVVIFSQKGQVLVGYQLSEEEEVKYCSWGGKKQSASTEKLFLCFKDNVYTYMCYIDAAHPEYQFMLSGDENNIDNLYNFIKNIAKEVGK